MASIDDLQGSGVYDDGKGKGGERVVSSGPFDTAGSGTSGPSSDKAGSGTPGPSSDKAGRSEAQEVATQGFAWSFDPS